MKITLLGPTYPYRGGIVQYNTNLGAQLRKSNAHSVQIMSWKRLYPNFLLPKSESEFQDHKSKKRIEFDDELRILDYLLPWTWIRVVNDVRKFKSEVFITHWLQAIHLPVYVVIFLLLRVFTKARIIVIAHNVKPHEAQKLGLLASKIAFTLAHEVMTHAKDEYVLAKKLVPKRGIKLGFLPVNDVFEEQKFDIDEFKKKHSLHKRVMLFFGFIRKYKGLEYLIEALNLLKDDMPDLDLLIAGKLFWEEKKKVSFLEKVKRIPFRLLKSVTIGKSKEEQYNPFKLIKKYGLEDRIKVFDDYIPNEEVYKYFLVSDVLVLPYISASQSGPIQIAYKFEKPVIASAVGGIKDAVKDNVSGFKCRPKDAQSLAETIQKFYNTNTDWRKQIRNFSKRFSWKNYINKLLEE